MSSSTLFSQHNFVGIIYLIRSQKYILLKNQARFLQVLFFSHAGHNWGEDYPFDAVYTLSISSKLHKPLQPMSLPTKHIKFVI